MPDKESLSQLTYRVSMHTFIYGCGESPRSFQSQVLAESSCLEILQTIIISWKERSYRLWVLQSWRPANPFEGTQHKDMSAAVPDVLVHKVAQPSLLIEKVMRLKA